MDEGYCPQCGYSADAKKKRTIGGFKVEPFGLKKGGTIIPLTRTEGAVLASILESHPRPRPVWAIVEDTWANRADFVSSEKMVHIYVHKIRKKLANAGVPAVINHVHKYTPEHGYVVAEQNQESAAA